MQTPSRPTNKRTKANTIKVKIAFVTVCCKFFFSSVILAHKIYYYALATIQCLATKWVDVEPEDSTKWCFGVCSWRWLDFDDFYVPYDTTEKSRKEENLIVQRKKANTWEENVDDKIHLDSGYCFEGIDVYWTNK